MNSQLPLQSLRRLAATVLGAAALCGTAQAAFVQGDWDPAYGAPFSNLGWSGSALINLSSECLASNGLVRNDDDPCSISVVNAVVRFYNLADPTGTVETLNFTNSVAVGDIFVESGEATAFSLVSTARVGSTSAEARPDGSTVNAFFELSIDYSVGSYDIYASAADYVLLSPPVASLKWHGNAFTESLGGVNREEAVVTVTQPPTTVSAPATLTLALVSLGLLGALRRR